MVKAELAMQMMKRVTHSAIPKEAGQSQGSCGAAFCFLQVRARPTKCSDALRQWKRASQIILGVWAN
jgi:hypothetical protein